MQGRIEKIVLASSNPGKLREIADLIAPFRVQAVSAGALGLPEPEETGTTFVANALIKARAAAEAAGSVTELARLDLDAGQVEAALNRLEPVRERLSDDLEFRSALAAALQRAGRSDEARDERAAVQAAVQQRGQARQLVRQLLDDSENLDLRRRLVVERPCRRRRREETSWPAPSASILTMS